MAWVCYEDRNQGSSEALTRLSWRTVYSYGRYISENVFCMGQSLSRKQIHPFPPPKGTGAFKEGLVYKEGRVGSIERNIEGRENRSCGWRPCAPLEPKSCSRVLLEQTGTAELAQEEKAPGPLYSSPSSAGVFSW